MRASGDKRRLPAWAIGLILIVVVAAGSFVAYTKKLPWSNPYEVTAVFETAQNLRPKAPVRIAGVQVGEVTKVEHLTSEDPDLQAQADQGDNPLPSDPSSGQQAAVVTMSLEEDALPLKEDAQMQLRPRLFLEGNLFVDLKPGSPNADTVSEDHTFPITQTSTSVSIDQVLTTLQSDVRANLQTFLDQFGNALIKYKGAEGFQELYRSSAGAGKYTSQVNAALLGKGPHDLSGLVGNLDKVVAALGQNELALQNLVTNFRTVTGSFAAESASLEQAIAELPQVMDAAKPAFANLNAAFPPLRAFAREALPGVRSTAPTLRVATPFIHQVRELVSEQELRGLVGDLRPAVPDLALLARRTKPLLDQTRLLSSCFNEVVIPWGYDYVRPDDSGGPAYPYDPVERGASQTGDGSTDPMRVFEETMWSVLGIASESHSGDANGQYLRVQAGGGSNTVILPGSDSPDPESPSYLDRLDPTGTGGVAGIAPSKLLGATPQIDDSAKTPFRPGAPCENQEPPDLSSTVGIGPAGQETARAPATPLAGSPDPSAMDLSQAEISDLQADAKRAAALEQQGRMAASNRLEADVFKRVSKAYAQMVGASGGAG